MTVLVAPFLINCAIATGDPFYAINNHTDFYLKREALRTCRAVAAQPRRRDVRPISAVAYSSTNSTSRPIAATDNAVRGVFVYPFSNKWVGLDRWYPGLGTALACLAIAGLVAWLWSAEGRLLLVMFFGSLVPFSMTWTVLGGAEWRLTFFAYAFYLVAAFWFVDKTDVLRASRASETSLIAVGSRLIALRICRVALVLRRCRAGRSLCPTPSLESRFATKAPPPSRRGPAIGGSSSTAGRAWSSREMSRHGLPRRPARHLRIVLPEARSYALTVRIDPVDRFCSGTTDRARLTERNPPRRSRA